MDNLYKKILNRNLKGGVPIRTFFVGGLIIFLFFVAALAFIGGSIHDNNLTSNSQNAANLQIIMNPYNSLSANGFINNNITKNVSGALQGSTGRNGSRVLQNASSFSNPLSSINIIANIFGSIPLIFGNITNFMAAGFQIAFGINKTLATMIVYGLLIGIPALAIISAWLIFPL